MDIVVVKVTQVNRLIRQQSKNCSIKITIEWYALDYRFANYETQDFGYLYKYFHVFFIGCNFVCCFVCLAQSEHAKLCGKGLIDAHVDPFSE